MKALTFLQYFKQFKILDKSKNISVYHGASNYSDEEPYICCDELDSLLAYHAFVSQPFRPEMVERFFETSGIEESNNKGWIKILINEFYIIFKFNSDGVFSKLYRIEEIKLFMPISLNDFISDCQRAGVELIFKQEIVTKFEL